MLRVVMNANPLCASCGRILTLRICEDGRTAYTETPGDIHCTDRCIIENTGKRLSLPVLELEVIK